MQALIFGANGQDGHYLIEFCRSNGIEPIAASRSAPFLQVDVGDLTRVQQVIAEYRPDYVFHMAANSTTRYEALFDNHHAISTGTLNILHSVKLHAPDAKVFITGSGVQFRNTGRPVSESDPFEALSPYAVARIQSVYAARYYRSLGIKTYVGYLFHHDSPFRKPNHVSQMIAQAVQRIRDGSQEKIQLGNLTSQKEWTFAGDVVRGIWTLMQQDKIFEAVIGSGQGHSIGQWLEQCFRIIDRDWRDHVVLQENFVAEYDYLVSNPRLIKSLGWEPQVGLAELAKMMVN